MSDRVAAGAWVEIHRVVLRVGERAPHVPVDTRSVPLEMRVRGFLVTAARLGDEVEIETRTGRRLRGTLIEVDPPYAHGFGVPIAELVPIAEEVRSILRARGRWQ